MILNDYSQLFIAGCLAFPADFKKGEDVQKMEEIARHSVLTSILGYKQKYSSKCGETILCCDGKENWRNDVFAHYKGRRKVNKKDSDTDWNSINSIMDTIRVELEEVFPFRVVMYNKAEGDDVIAVLVKYSQTNETIQTGLEEYPQNVMVVSADHDFRQLYKYNNYAQFSPIQKKVVESADHTFLLEKVLIGDAGDGVPNVRSADDHFMDENSGRQKPITAAMKQAFFEKPDGSTLTEEERTRLARNRMLMDFEYIPKDVEAGIIHAYKTFEIKGTQQKVHDYFIKNRCRQLLNDVPAFFKA